MNMKSNVYHIVNNKNKRDAHHIIECAIKNGTTSIVFDKICTAGGYSRRFQGTGSLSLSLTDKRMQIYGAGGFIALVPVESKQEAIDYITSNFCSMSPRYAAKPVVAMAMA